MKRHHSFISSVALVLSACEQVNSLILQTEAYENTITLSKLNVDGEIKIMIIGQIFHVNFIHFKFRSGTLTLR